MLQINEIDAVLSFVLDKILVVIVILGTVAPEAGE